MEYGKEPTYTCFLIVNCVSETAPVDFSGGGGGGIGGGTNRFQQVETRRTATAATSSATTVSDDTSDCESDIDIVGDNKTLLM